MTTSKLPGRLVVDASVLLSALIGGRANDLAWNPRFDLVTTAHTIREVTRYLPTLADKSGVALDVVSGALRLLPITVYRSSFYRTKVPQARELIGGRDPGDVDLLALSLKVSFPIWTSDRDFAGLWVEVYTTAQLAACVRIACGASCLPCLQQAGR